MTTAEMISLGALIAAIVASAISIWLFFKTKDDQKTEKKEDHYILLSSKISSLEGKFEKLDIIQEDISEIKGKNAKTDEKILEIEKKLIDLQHSIANDLRLLQSEAHRHPSGLVGEKLFK